MENGTNSGGGGGSGERQSHRLPLSDVVSDCLRRWFQDTLKEAKAGDLSMQVLVAQMYFNGYGIPKDHQKFNECLVSSVCTRGINYRGRKRGLLTCYPDTDLAIAKKLMEAKGIKQLPVVQRAVDFQEERKRRIVGILYYHSIWNCLREELHNRGQEYQPRSEDHTEEKISNGH